MKRTFLIAASIFSVTFLPFSAFAQSGEIAEQACDPAYWTTMKERAWLEAEREIMQNQNLIFKPDSVLEYTCFDKFLNHAAKNLGDIFVHTNYFGDPIIARTENPEGQGHAIKTAVFDAMKSYLESNYDPDFLSGRAPKMQKPPGITNLGNAPEVTTENGNNYSNCRVMAEVWMASKCLNFAEDEFVSDSFHPFVTIEKGPNSKVDDVPGYTTYEDVRIWPTLCSNMTASKWETTYNRANNMNDFFYEFQNPTKKAFEEVRKMVEPGACGDDTPAIMTGVTVVLSGTDSSGEPDGFCTNPGCTYTGGECL